MGNNGLKRVRNTSFRVKQLESDLDCFPKLFTQNIDYLLYLSKLSIHGQIFWR
jgi:hypothetical protein